jgi:predicted Zn-dependent protease with MMP-like domain
VHDTIYVFQRPLEEDFPDVQELEDEIRVTVLHEIGHHFGLDDDEIEKLGFG